MVAVALYCERTGSGFWAEPLNAWTNAAFVIVAALIVLRLVRQGNPRRWSDVWLLAFLAATVGVGSFLWHTLHAPWSQWADIIPILLFINVFLLSFLIRIAALGAGAALLWLLVYNAFNIGLQLLLPPGFMNGSVFYLPTWIALLFICVFTLARDRRRGQLLLMAASAFSAALLLRTLDRSLCASFPTGTHFGWHVLNGLVLYLATAALLPRRASAGVASAGLD